MWTGTGIDPRDYGLAALFAMITLNVIHYDFSVNTPDVFGSKWTLCTQRSQDKCNHRGLSDLFRQLFNSRI